MPSTAGPSTFSAYASRFLSGKTSPPRGRGMEDDSQIFRATSPSPHDPFITSPTASTSQPYLAGGLSPPAMQTPPFPGIGIDDLPDIGDGSIGVGLLFDGPKDMPESDPPRRSASRSKSRGVGKSKKGVPNPYETSSEEEAEMPIDVVASVRQSLIRPPQPAQKPLSKRAQKGWLAHQSIFPASSSSDSEESDKITEEDSEIGEQDEDEDDEGYMLSPSELYKASMRPPAYSGGNLQEPLLGPDELISERDGRRTTVPTRLHLYQGRFGHWEGDALRKYKGLFPTARCSNPPSPVHHSPPPTALRSSRTNSACTACIPAVAPEDRSTRPVSNRSDRWWGTTGLRIGALLLWLLAAMFGRMVWLRRKRLERAAAVVELSTHLLLTHTPLLLLTPLLLSIFAVLSIPFLTMLLRLGMIGYWRHPRENTWVFHIRPYAGWLIFLVTLIWVWTWSVLRGIGRVAVAGVVGEWYFHRDDPGHPSAVDVTTAAVHRATGTSLGSICLGSGIVAIVRVVGRSAAELRRITSPRNPLPAPVAFLSKLTPLFAVIASVLDQLNGYALVYVGLTGEAFWPSAKRAVNLAGRRKGGRFLDYTLIKLLLTLSSTAVGLFTATAGYLYMTHTLANPGYAPFAALLCGGIPFLAIRAGAAVLGDTADALFICHQIDRELGGGHCPEAKKAFEGEPRDVESV
ncbi:hypothetical protein TREMEDRAFT_40073 [Tremella mesenterica DSM 1558]|uniref:uncharacterized protein n=1 Tax=Tremella mesenterica (strain ATCC 24925 / CBS 8224 / DSM 1558 / NBRC 9311 / NRRL Y-6157 / RJB 2259-6 / UBC 559-6) TaxID=578456 RepID=UPI0003F49CD6|nr:uncharacterized protein TREMEDRAFT_40073 [Tremella mesenterica DSM 1558]EIW67934.1 hypothetical protein TREMEDRAFT_40073 [Tremella mesenterica DSM 1558]